MGTLSCLWNRRYDSRSGPFTQQDPIGVAGGANVYGFAGGDPVNFSDPFGLSAMDTQLQCRAVGGTGEGNAAHCAVRVVDKERGLDVTIELLNEGTNQIYWRSAPGEAAREGYSEDGWTTVAVPEGMSSREFDDKVLQSAFGRTMATRGVDYSMFGSKNSNRFVHDVITGAGGRVPGAAAAGYTFAPGLCGGRGLRRGSCAP